MQYLHSIDWQFVGGFAGAIAVLLFLWRMMSWDIENEPEILDGSKRNNTNGDVVAKTVRVGPNEWRTYYTIADNAVTDRKLDTLPGSITWMGDRLVGERDELPKHSLFTNEQLYEEWRRDCLETVFGDKDLDWLANKWRGRVPKKPLPVRDSRYSARELSIDIAEFMKKAIDEQAMLEDPNWSVSLHGDLMYLVNPRYAARVVSTKVAVSMSLKEALKHSRQLNFAEVAG